MQVVRFDSPGEVLGIVENADGSVSATATTSRCGIYGYRRADGTVKRELVLPEHLFNAQSLATLASVALTMEPPAGHPPVMLDPDNAGRFSKGHVHETVDAIEAPTEQDFGYARVRFTARVRDAVDRLKAAKTGKALFTSPGYLLPAYDATPGVHPIWGSYDAIQGPRVYNHLALTDTPRGGPAMVVHMDGADVAEQEFSQPGPGARIGGSMSTVKVRLDGIGREVEIDPVGAEILRQEFARRDADEMSAKGALARYEALKAECDALKATIDAAVAAMEKEAEPEPVEGEAAPAPAPKMDALATDAPLGQRLGRLLSLSARRDGHLTAERQARADAQKRADAASATLKDPTQLRAHMAPRVALETTARQVLATDQHARIDAMSDDEIRVSVTGVLFPHVKLDGVTGDRLVGLYEGALATRQPRTDAAPPERAAGAPVPGAAPKQGGAMTEAEAHKARMDADYRAANKRA